MAEEKRSKKHKHSQPGGIFIPAGLFIGMGIGFITGNLPAGLFIGLGSGFAGYAISLLIRKNGCC
jgi:hypothetical protein